MKPLLPLIQREWLQHRFGWTLMATLPTALALLVFGFDELDLDTEASPEVLPSLVTLASLAGGVGVHLAIFALAGLIIITGLARRDHADRSVEFWLSLPTGHAPSLAVPLLVHLLLLPMAALFIGLLSGGLVSAMLVSRLAGVGEWLALPWGNLLIGALAMLARLSLGLVLALLWLAPIVLAVVLATALLKRWGLVALAVVFGLGSVILERLFGQPFLSDWLRGWLSGAGRSLLNASGGSVGDDATESFVSVLDKLVPWALGDAADALRLAASPLLLGGLLLAAAFFAALVEWRRRGADAGS